MTFARKKATSPKPIPTISDAEWVVMQVIWRLGRATANQVVAALEARMAWKPKTIQTLLRRLVQKKALACNKQGREHEFRPLVEAADCIRVASRSFLDRFFGGQVAPFLACFLESESPSRGELEELRRILEKKRS